MKVNSIIAGLGEVGGALKKVLEEHYEVVGIDVNTKREDYPDSCENLNVCIPYSGDFIGICNKYISLFSPQLTIVHSSVPIGTTKQLKGNVVHSPVRGRHPNIYEDLKRYVKFVGYNDDLSFAYATQYLNIFKTVFTKGTDTTEFLKIVSLAKYMAYLGIADEINEMAKIVDVDYEDVKLWDKTQNDQIQHSYDDMQLPILNPPKGRPGGHCVMPVTELLIHDKRFNPKIISQIFSKY